MKSKNKPIGKVVKEELAAIVEESRGDFGVGQIAAIVAGIVIIGVIIAVVTGLLPEWIEQLWTWITELFESAGP